MVGVFAGVAGAQQDPLLDELGIGGSILDEAPFDVITLKKESSGRSVRVNPLDFPNRKLPTAPKESDRFKVTFPIFPDRIYEIAWREIEKVILFEDLVVLRANKLLEEKKFSEAFEHLNFLMIHYPKTPGIPKLRRDFLYRSATEMATAKRLPHALGVLEEFQRTFPEDKDKDKIRNAISNVANQLVDSYFEKKDLANAKALVERLDADYKKNPLPVVEKWKGKFLELATSYREQALEARDAGNYSKARRLAMNMLSVAPDIEGGKDMLNTFIREFPMIRVGVFQTSDKPDTASLADWPAFRVGQLISKPLFEFRSTGPEGGQYRFGFGSFQHSDDRTELDLMIQSPGKDGVPDSLSLSQALLKRATVGSSTYVPGWAAIVESVSIFGPERLKLKLSRPHVLPQAFMQWSSDATGQESNSKTLYRYAGEADGIRRFQLSESNTQIDFQPREIQEILYEDPQQAISDLIRGDIEIIDRLFPADARLLAGVNSVSVDQYALPMVHMLIPKTHNAYLDDREFRRALLYAINREAILNDEILGGRDTNLSRVVSGPFPAGASDSDPIAYAYNGSVENLAYDPRLAKVLIMLTNAKLKNMADKKGQSLPPIPTIKLGVPNYESARVAGAAIVQSWKLIGLPAELVTLNGLPSSSADSPVDFVYASAAVWEPATDAERLFGIGGPAESDNQFIVHALGQLNVATNWKEVRQGCQDLHALVAAHLPILPLWQVGESFAYRKEATGIAKKPTGLYQDVNKWRYQAK